MASVRKSIWIQRLLRSLLFLLVLWICVCVWWWVCRSQCSHLQRGDRAWSRFWWCHVLFFYLIIVISYFCYGTLHNISYECLSLSLPIVGHYTMKIETLHKQSRSLLISRIQTQEEYIQIFYLLGLFQELRLWDCRQLLLIVQNYQCFISKHM